MERITEVQPLDIPQDVRLAVEAALWRDRRDPRVQWFAERYGLNIESTNKR